MSIKPGDIFQASWNSSSFTKVYEEPSLFARVVHVYQFSSLGIVVAEGPHQEIVGGSSRAEERRWAYVVIEGRAGFVRSTNIMRLNDENQPR